MEHEANSPCYIGRHSCGKIVAATVIREGRKAELVEFLGECVMRGDMIEQMNSASVRAEPWCECFTLKRAAVTSEGGR